MHEPYIMKYFPPITEYYLKISFFLYNEIDPRQLRQQILLCISVNEDKLYPLLNLLKRC